MNATTRVRVIAAVSLAVFIGSVVLANYFIVHGLPFGLSTPTGFGTYSVPVGFGLYAPAGTYVAALTFSARDLLQRSAGRLVGVAAILVAGAISYWVSNPTIAVASAGTFLISESLDFAVYTPLQRRWFVPAVIVSGCVASVVDSLVFLKWAGIPYSGNLAGLIVGKLWIVTLIGGAVAWSLRRRLPVEDALLPI